LGELLSFPGPTTGVLPVFVSPLCFALDFGALVSSLCFALNVGVLVSSLCFILDVGVLASSFCFVLDVFALNLVLLAVLMTSASMMLMTTGVSLLFFVLFVEALELAKVSKVAFLRRVGDKLVST
jgi:hypothetical protein